jgi:trk system potassium uptake protein TrkH
MIRWPAILHILGSLMVCIGLCMLLPIGFSLYYWDGSAVPLLESAAITTGLGLVLYLTFRRNRVKGAISHREGMAITTIGWVAACIFGGLPFYLSGVLPHVVDCIFETTSGFTTTGASVIRNVEIVAPGILFWRSLTHWLGGLGIVVLGLAILPFLGVGGMQLYKAEVPGPVVDKLKPRLKDTAMILWKVYVAFTVAETILLLIGGMNLLDALCHTFGTLATGGFSTKNTSIGYYHSVYIDTVVTIFMLLGGINFALHFQFFRGKPLAMWRDSEFRFFMGFWLLLTLVIAFNCYGSVYASFWKSLQYASFTVASITTTTGYATANFELWPSLSLCLLLLCMVVGASVGSTGGAVKCMRIMVVLKHGYRELIRLIHPRAVVRLKMGDQAVPPEVFDGISGFIFLYVGLSALSMFLVASAGVDLVTTFSAVLACLGNVGPGLGNVGPMDNYADVPTFAKWILTLDMLLGRLEIYTVIILLVPRFYKK